MGCTLRLLCGCTRCDRCVAARAAIAVWLHALRLLRGLLAPRSMCGAHALRSLCGLLAPRSMCGPHALRSLCGCTLRLLCGCTLRLLRELRTADHMTLNIITQNLILSQLGRVIWPIQRDLHFFFIPLYFLLFLQRNLRTT